MSDKKKNGEKRYCKEALLQSKRFSHIQQDFLKAILIKDSYTVTEAVAAVTDFFGGEK